MMNFTDSMEALRQQRGGKCSVCKARSSRYGRKRGPLHFAYVKPTALTFICTGRGGWNRYYDIKNNPDCYQLMCNLYHREYDNRRFSHNNSEKTG